MNKLPVYLNDYLIGVVGISPGEQCRKDGDIANERVAA
jgi:hypothetical protein